VVQLHGSGRSTRDCIDLVKQFNNVLNEFNHKLSLMHSLAVCGGGSDCIEPRFTTRPNRTFAPIFVDIRRDTSIILTEVGSGGPANHISLLRIEFLIGLERMPIVFSGVCQTG